MARPREFDTDLALERAMNVYWENGFEGASLPQLLEGTKLSRGSLYKAFADKKSLFMQTMSRYEEKAVAPAVAYLRGSAPGDVDGLIRIDTVFNRVVDAVRKGDRRGCMLCSAAAGPAFDDDEIAEAVHKMLDQMKFGFEAALSQSLKYSDVSVDERSEMADMLVTHYTGLRILSRSQTSADVLQHSVNSLLHLLNR